MGRISFQPIEAIKNLWKTLSKKQDRHQLVANELKLLKKIRKYIFINGYNPNYLYKVLLVNIWGFFFFFGNYPLNTVCVYISIFLNQNWHPSI